MGVADGIWALAVVLVAVSPCAVLVLEVLSAVVFRKSLSQAARKSAAMIKSAAKSWLLPLARVPLRSENLFHPNLEEVRPSFLIEISSGAL
jgi:hypothetical protein